MSNLRTAYHIEKGATPMHPVDIAHACGQFPLEWSRVPWTDAARDAALPKLRDKRQEQAKDIAAQRHATLNPYDPSGLHVVGPMAGQTQHAPAGAEAGDPLTPAYAKNEKTVASEADLHRLEAEEKQAHDDLAKAQTDLEAAQGRNDQGAVADAQKRIEAANDKLADVDRQIGDLGK